MIDDEPGVPGVFDFTIGNPNLVGGINRIRILIYKRPKACSVQWNEIRD